MKLSELLFNAKNRDIRCAKESNGTTYKVGSTAAPGMGVSKARGKKGTEASAKMSRIALIFDKIICDKSLFLATLNDGAQGYAEYIDENEVVYAGVYDSNGVRWLNGNVPESKTVQLAPVYAYSIGEHNQTHSTFEDCVTFGSVIEVDSLAPSLVFSACDAFYYEFAINHKEEIDDSGILLEQEIRQLNRTNGIEILTPDSFTPVYANVTHASSDGKIESNDDWESIKNGNKFVAYDWKHDQMSKVPELSTLDKFVPSEDFFELLDMCSECVESVLTDIDAGIPENEAIKANYINSILVGKPGTGKTSLAYALGASLGMPVYTVTNSKNTEEDCYEGKNKVVDGKITFCPTSFLEAYKNGGIIVLEEFNLVAPDVLMGAIGQAIEAPFILMEDGYKEVRRHPLCIILATMNTCTQGSKEPNEAFTSRCPDVFLLDDPEAGDFIKILEADGNDKEISTKVYNTYSAILTYLNDNSYEDVALSITMRHCLAALKAIKRGRSFKRAIKRTMVNAIGVKDIALAREVYETVVEPMRSE